MNNVRAWLCCAVICHGSALSTSFSVTSLVLLGQLVHPRFTGTITYHIKRYDIVFTQSRMLLIDRNSCAYPHLSQMWEGGIIFTYFLLTNVSFPFLLKCSKRRWSVPDNPMSQRLVFRYIKICITKYNLLPANFVCRSVSLDASVWN